ncbi:universal stress protein [Aciditerrimonas ferrireducens]|jgi:nucleotide-binding universal stress UspA family protein|uniref:universal stress protein n=1 Tax=Aciditerrimonas ferrireducens TaxID=667306 RepID=UPI00200311A2|nr:universal stress protein [Aciditerrimonas ferrireducens]MCK4177161.1 universal stress protein [Aciditerrimonas ferrireducens]
MADVVVVGVDGSPGSSAALRFAAEEARLRGAVLRVLRAWTVPVGAYAPVPYPAELYAEVAPQTERLLRSQVAEVLGEEPGIPVDERVVEGPPAKVLVDEAGGAILLVVGSRGHGGFAGLLLGSTSAQVVHHAPCPVVVVPAGRPG